MTGGSSFVNVFGGAVIKPAQPSFLALTIVTNTQLVWPIETTESTPGVAAQINVTAAGSGLNLMMPPGDTGSVGAQSIIVNVGSNTFTVTDQSGNSIAPITTTQAWVITLVDNSTANGTWQALQLASTTSSATAASLAGAGLQANGSLLQLNWPSHIFSGTSFNFTTAQRATLVIFTGTADATSVFTQSSNILGAGFVCAVANYGTAIWQIGANPGLDDINGQDAITLEPGASGFIFVATAYVPPGPTLGHLFTVGALVSTLTIPQGGTGATSAPQALVNLGGTGTGISIFTAPTAAAVVSLLGLNSLGYTESTINTNQTLSTTSGNTAFICTSALTLTLPLTTTLTNKFNFIVYAQNGNVTVTPQASDGINGGGSGANYTIPSGASAFFFTDAIGNWWPALSSFLASGGTIDGNLVVTGSAEIGALLTADAGITVATGGIEVTFGGIDITSGGLMVQAGGANINAGGMSVVDGVNISSGGLAVTGGGVFDDLTVTAAGTAGDQAINFSQFPNTLGGTGTQTFPGGLIMKWGSGSVTSGTGTPVTFAANFPTACQNVQLTINGATVPITLNALAVGALSTSGFTAYGASTETVGFYWLAIGN